MDNLTDMECPFELPAKPKDKCNYTKNDIIDIVDKNGVYLATIRNIEIRAYIVQAINSHKKLVEALEEAGRDFYYIHQHSEDAHEDSYKFTNKVKQALEAEKKE